MDYIVCTSCSCDVLFQTVFSFVLVWSLLQLLFSSPDLYFFIPSDVPKRPLVDAVLPTFTHLRGLEQSKIDEMLGKKLLFERIAALGFDCLHEAQFVAQEPGCVGHQPRRVALLQEGLKPRLLAAMQRCVREAAAQPQALPLFLASVEKMFAKK
eukprot:GCRY01005312.1.p1 GENE.GCRY01005312.1~~GCRY01005312.1.p1  ORF type:complete len:154 (+),score=29.54 GCRY01005312.1:676-1137(+)